MKTLSSEPQRILIFGDGLGFESAYLALAGHRVDYFEVSEACRHFARMVFTANNVTVHQIGDANEIAAGEYDTVICLDVLEHIPNPISVSALLAKALKPGGHLIVHAPFWYVAPEVPTHLRENQRYSGDWKNLYGAFSLWPVQVAGLWMPLVLKKSREKPATSFFVRIRVHLAGTILKFARVWSGPLILAARWGAKPVRASANDR